MANDWIIRLARRSDLAQLADIEREAGLRFDTIPELADLPEVLAPPGALTEALEVRLLWVAASAAADAPIGFTYADPRDGNLHLEELDVLPAWGRRGIGRALVAAVVEEAGARGLPAVTLTTFRDVVWNAPFYAGLGFRVLAPGELSPGLVALLAEEERRGLPATLRVVMRFEVSRDRSS
jgi:GNAT superfamily N-acetyltransferase